MILEKLHKFISMVINYLKGYTDRYWFPPFIGFLAAIDNIILIIPSDGVLISSSMMLPRRWFIFALNVAIGSTLGALLVVAIVEIQGLPWLLDIYPGLNATNAWIWTHSVFEKYGLIIVFVIGLSPLAQQPIIILAGLADIPLLELGGVIGCSRLIKFMVLAYIGSHAPKYLNKFWGIKGELKDAGISLDQK